MSVQNREHRTHFQDVSVSGNVLAATDITAGRTLITGKAKYTIYVQSIKGAVNTDAAQAQTFRDSAGTPVVVATIKASPGVGSFSFDFGDEGYALTEGKNLVLIHSATGLAYTYSVEAYMKPTSTMLPSDL